MREREIEGIRNARVRERERELGTREREEEGEREASLVCWVREGGMKDGKKESGNEEWDRESGRKIRVGGREPDQTFAIVLVPALTKMEVKFCFLLPSAVAPLRHPQNNRNGARAEGDTI
jgi:hypothetical protein